MIVLEWLIIARVKNISVSGRMTEKIALMCVENLGHFGFSGCSGQICIVTFFDVDPAITDD